MFCVKCGNSMTPGRRFCSHCGAQKGNSGEQESAKQDLLIGRTIDNRYRLDTRLGAGGMGTVYSATRLLIGDVVAVKILHSEQVENPQMLERFRREAQATARLKHPNAVAIHDFGVSSEGLVYLVMELVEGESLRALARRQGQFNSSVAVEIISQACSALDEAHQLNIVHRDIKPDNIVVATTSAGLRVKVLDFGVAKFRDLTASADHLTQSGAVMGTPHYMSPEQCLGEEIDGRSDIYSLGIVLYELLAGTVPFNSPTSTAIVVQQVTQAPPSLRAINISITPALEAVVLHALEKKPEARPRTAIAFMQELTAAVKGERVTQAIIAGASQLNALPPVFSLGTAAAPNGNLITQFSTPMSGSVTPVGPLPVPSGAVGSPPKSNRLVPLLIAAFLVLIMGGGGAVWLLRPARAEQRITETQTSQDSSEKTPSDTSQPTGNMTTDAGPTIPPAPPGMAYVQGSEFLMGCDIGEEYERPKHTVTVNPFFIDLYEVTNEQYEEFIEATDRKAPHGWANGHPASGAARRPVTGVDWDDAKAYAEWKGKRLPTEEEWEFAARGTDGRRFPWGNQWKPWAANAASTGHAHPENVGEHLAGPSPFGAFDMAGNVWEWTASDFTPYSGNRASAQSADGAKVVRGGSYQSNINEATTTVRRGRPARGGQDYHDVGFRCAKDTTP